VSVSEVMDHALDRALASAVETQNLAWIENYLNEGGDIDRQFWRFGSKTASLLLTSCLKGHLDLVSFLLSRGANVEILAQVAVINILFIYFETFSLMNLLSTLPVSRGI
jgi:ankyrin repeat protein